MSDGVRKTYMATVTGNTLSVSRNKGTPSVKIKVQTMYEASDVSKAVVFTAYGNLWLTYATMEKTWKTLKEVFGWESMNIETLKEPILVGKKVQIVGEHVEYEGKSRFEINFFNKPGGMQGVNDEELAKLIAEVQPMLDEVVGNAPVEFEQETIPANPNYDGSGPVNSQSSDEYSSF